VYSVNQARYFSEKELEVPIIENINRVNECYAWSVDYKGTLTGTLRRISTRLVSNPTCPSLIRKSSLFRSANRDRDGCMPTDAYRVRTSIASSSLSSRPTGLNPVLPPDCVEIGR